MFCKVDVIAVQTQLSSVMVDDPLIRCLLEMKQDFQTAIHDFGCPVHPERDSSSCCGRGC